MDEVMLTFDIPLGRSVAEKGQKTLTLKITGHEKSRFIVVLACCADGTKLPPMLIFKRKTLPKDIFSPTVVVQANAKGWTDEETMDKILTANDELTNVINIYKKTTGLEPAVNGGSSTTVLNDTHGWDCQNAAVSAAPVAAAAAGSLLDLDSPGPDVREEPKKVPVDLSLLDDQLLALGIGDPCPPIATSSMVDLGSLSSPGLPQASTNASAGGAAGAGTFGGFGNAAAPPGFRASYIPASAGVFQPMSVGPKTLPLGPSMLAPMEGHPLGSPSKVATDDLLNNLFVPLEQIQPGSQAPVNLHQEMGCAQ
nr:ADP-ribosylation factor-binding protein GGA1-like [Rhipicephalus microplus]